MTLAETRRTAVDRRFDVLLGGRPMVGAARYEVEDPTTGGRLTDAPDCSAEEVDRIVLAAAEAQRAWGAMPPRARAAKVREFAALLRAHTEELATLDALDAGFPLSVMRADVDAAATLPWVGRPTPSRRTCITACSSPTVWWAASSRSTTR